MQDLNILMLIIFEGGNQVKKEIRSFWTTFTILMFLGCLSIVGSAFMFYQFYKFLF